MSKRAAGIVLLGGFEVFLRPAQCGSGSCAFAILENPNRTVKGLVNRASRCNRDLSPKSHISPAMTCDPWRIKPKGRCSFGACWQQPRYECGTQIVGNPNNSAKMSLGSEPPVFGKIAG